MKSAEQQRTSETMFSAADWYDRTIDWSARLAREIPVLVDVFGPPGGGAILDAGCGTGHQASALAQHGYRVIGADSSEEMLEVARRTAQAASADVEFLLTPYSGLYEALCRMPTVARVDPGESESGPGRPGKAPGFDGVYCVGNSLAAAGTRDAVAEAVGQFGKCLRPGGRLFLQVLNFAPMRLELPCVRGPRVSKAEGLEYVSVRHFHFTDESAQVTNVTIWHDAGWKCRTHAGTLYPVSLDELQAWCESSGLRIDTVWGSYAGEPFEIDRSIDLLIVATRVKY